MEKNIKLKFFFKIFAAVAGLAVLFGLGAWLYLEIKDEKLAKPFAMSEPTNFNEVGVLHFPAPEIGQAEGTFEYQDGSMTVSKKLVLDELSVCASANGAIPCMAMSVTFNLPFDGRTALVEGTLEGDTIIVRKLRTALEGEQLRSFEPGNVFISWMTAIELFNECRVKTAMQTHALDVYLVLEDGSELRAVEPQIDEVFRIIEMTKGECGTFPVATE